MFFGFCFFGLVSVFFYFGWFRWLVSSFLLDCNEWLRFLTSEFLFNGWKFGIDGGLNNLSWMGDDHAPIKLNRGKVMVSSVLSTLCSLVLTSFILIQSDPPYSWIPRNSMQRRQMGPWVYLFIYFFLQGKMQYPWVCFLFFFFFLFF